MSCFSPALDVANAVLYEGYILYPYTASARKNRIRWQFGVIVPHAYAELSGTGEPAESRTEVLLESSGETEVDVVVRFLQVEMRQVEAWTGTSFEPVERLTVGGQTYLTFDEGVEREVPACLRISGGSAVAVPIAFSADENVELLRDAGDALRGRIVRRRWPLHGAVVAEWEALPDRPALYKVRVRVENRSAVVPGERSSALRTAFVSTHTLLHATGGAFLLVARSAGLRGRTDAADEPAHVARFGRGRSGRSEALGLDALVADHFVRFSRRCAPQSEGRHVRRNGGRRVDDAERAEPVGRRTSPRRERPILGHERS